MICDASRCTSQIMAFYRCLDERDYSGLLSLLTEDAQWHRQGRLLCGKQQVMEAMQQRSVTQRIAHVITNLVIDHIDQNRCAMRGYMLVVRYDDGSPINGPAPLNGIESLRTVHIQLEQRQGLWLIHTMHNDAVAFTAI